MYFFKPSFLLLIIALVLGQARLLAQPVAVDTFRITLPNAEKIFLQKNLALIASRYNIDANLALAQQAKLWDSPILLVDQNIYDGKFFRHKTVGGQQYGQVFVQVQQLIRTAGKRTKLAQLATDNAMLAQQQFDDLMRGLRYTLQSDFIEILHLLKIKKVYDAEVEEVNRLVKAMDEEYKLGDISLKENMRIKALLFSLQNELVNIANQLIPLQSEIKLLLQTDTAAFVYPEAQYQLPQLIHAVLPGIDSLHNLALVNRPDALIARAQLLQQQHNLLYQKALAKPDITIAPEYDRLNSYQPNYVGLTISLPINLLNKNQGNIKAAQIAVSQQQVQISYQDSRISAEVKAAYEKVKYFQGINNPEQLGFSKNYEQLFQHVVESYRARQISLLDFTDFLDSYKDILLKLTEQHFSLVKSFAELNYTVNKNIIKL